MFETKFKKCLEILDAEIEMTQRCYNSCINQKYDCITDSKIRNEMILQNLKLMDKYLNKLEGLCSLKRNIQSEIGV